MAVAEKPAARYQIIIFRPLIDDKTNFSITTLVGAHFCVNTFNNDT